MMWVVRVLVLSVVLVAGSVLAFAPAARGAAPTASKACASLKSLNTKLNKVVDSQSYDSGSISDLSKSFKNGAKSAPKSLKSSMSTIAAVASDAASAGSTSGAAAVLKKDTQKLAAAVLKWTQYLETKCGGSTTSTS
jgi:hypothetical protein